MYFLMNRILLYLKGTIDQCYARESVIHAMHGSVIHAMHGRAVATSAACGRHAASPRSARKGGASPRRC